MKQKIKTITSAVMTLAVMASMTIASFAAEVVSESDPNIVYHLSKEPVGTIIVDPEGGFGGPYTVYELEEGTVISTPGRTMEGYNFLMYSNTFMDGGITGDIRGDELVMSAAATPRWAEEGVFNNYHIVSMPIKYPHIVNGGIGGTVDYGFWAVLAESDIPDTGKIISNWAKPQVDKAVSNNLVPEDKLNKDYTKPITRGEFAALAVSTYEAATGKTATCKSAQFADGANQDMAIMYELGVIGGYNKADNQAGVTVGINDPITREQAAVILAKLAAVTGKSLAPADTVPFTDSISDWAMDGVSKVYNAGIMSGYDTGAFGSQDKFTTEQSIVTMLHTFELAQ